MEKKPISSKPKTTTSREDRKKRLSLYPLTLEDAIRAAAQTGRPPPPEAHRANRQLKKQGKPTPKARRE
jgi:hypothetical protein